MVILSAGNIFYTHVIIKSIPIASRLIIISYLSNPLITECKIEFTTVNQEKIFQFSIVQYCNKIMFRTIINTKLSDVRSFFP